VTRKILAASVATVVAVAPSLLLAQNNAAKIATALSAAPPAIAAAATVVDFDATGKEVVLKQGTNGWVCLPSQPSRGMFVNNAICFDQNFGTMLKAMLSGKPPADVKGVGYSYMLSNDWWEGNTAPTDTVKTDMNEWHHTGNHVMIYYPDKSMLAGLPTHPSTTGPYVMWPNTPYAHVMWPVK
jgi:hypothetical protein